MAQIDSEDTQLLQQHAISPATEVGLVLDQGRAYFGPRISDVAGHLQSIGAAPYMQLLYDIMYIIRGIVASDY